MKKHYALAALPLMLLGCEGDKGQAYVAAVEIAQCGITDIEISDDLVVIRESDETVQWSASTVAAFTQPDDCNFDISWSSDTESVATISSTGLISTVSAGTTNITAAIGRFSTSAVFTVSDAAITSISLDPATVSINECTSETITATGVYADGSSRDITDLSKLSWSTDDQTLATVADIAASGVTLASHASGAGALTVSHSAGVDTTASLSLLETLSSISLSPTTIDLQEGDTHVITATGNYSDNTSTNISQQSEWVLRTAEQASFVTLDNTYGTKGNLTATNAGIAIVTVECGGLNATTDATVTVTEVPTLSSVSFSTTADPLYLSTDDTDEVLVLNATYSDGSIVDVSEDSTWEVITGDDDYIEIDDSSGDKGEIILSSDIDEITSDKSVIVHATFDDTTAQIEVIVVAP